MKIEKQLERQREAGAIEEQSGGQSTFILGSNMSKNTISSAITRPRTSKLDQQI